MALPTTRYGRFVHRKRKYAKLRRRLAVNNAGAGRPPKGAMHGGGKVRQRQGTGLQLPHGVHPDNFSGKAFRNLSGPGGTAVYSGGGKHGWPHVRITQLLYRNNYAAGKHVNTGWSLLHHRRAKYTGKIVGRANGYGRRVYGAQWFMNFNGYWPDWDPLGRHPNWVDIQNGAEYVTGWFQ